MNIPSGYVELNMVGFTDRGIYNANTYYVKNDLVSFGANKWRCKVDDTINITPAENSNWTIFIQSGEIEDITELPTTVSRNVVYRLTEFDEKDVVVYVKEDDSRQNVAFKFQGLGFSAELIGDNGYYYHCVPPIDKDFYIIDNNQSHKILNVDITWNYVTINCDDEYTNTTRMLLDHAITLHQTSTIIKYYCGNPNSNVFDELQKTEDLFDIITSKTPCDITARISDLQTAIAEENLEKYGYKIGDYFIGPQTGYQYYLADLNTYKGEEGERGSYPNVLTSLPHLSLIVLPSGITVSSFSISAKTSWGVYNATQYNNSRLYSKLNELLPKITNDINQLFDDNNQNDCLLSKYIITNSVGTYTYMGLCTIRGLTEAQIYGFPQWSIDQYQQGESDKKLEIFNKYRYSDIFKYNPVWLRSIASNDGDTHRACCIDSYGIAGCADVEDECYVAGLIILKGKEVQA